MESKITSLICIIVFLISINYSVIYAVYTNSINNTEGSNITTEAEENADEEGEETENKDTEEGEYNTSANTENQENNEESDTSTTTLGTNNSETTTSKNEENSTEKSVTQTNSSLQTTTASSSLSSSSSTSTSSSNSSSSTTAKQTISDGIYTISTAIDTSKVLDVSGGSTSNSANIQIWDEDKVDQQKFQVTYLNNGYYKITSLKSSKVLDVANGSTKSGANVQQYTSNNTYAQQWIIQESSVSGYYNIVSRCSGMYLDVDSASNKNGTNVQVYTNNGSKAQRFKFTLAAEYNGTQTISDGIYYISSCLDSSKVLDISGGSTASGANLQIWDKNNVSQQKFIVLYLGNGYYSIECMKSGMVLDVKEGKKANGTNVRQYTSNSTNAQKWVIKDAGDGYYYIISRCGGMYLDVSYGNTENGTNVQIYAGNGTKAQKFKFVDVGIGGGQTIEDGTYYISTKLNSNKVLDVDGASKSNGANIQIWNNDEVKQQRFTITYLGNGFYKIQNVNSGKVLDVANGSTKSGANVWQYTSNGTNAQQWIIKDCGDGYYNIISRCSGMYLDVKNASKSNGTNVQVYKGNGTNAQKFTFIKVDTNGIDVSKYNTITSWSKIANAGIDFTFVRVGYRGSSQGTLVKDTKFDENASGAISNGITCGVYFVTQAISYAEGKEEANYVLSIIKNYSITGPVAIDVESSTDGTGRADNISVSARTEAIKGFCETIENAGYTAAVYANKYWLTSKINTSELSKYTVWLAHYVTGAPTKTSDYTGSYLYWQYSSTGSVSGITGYVDLDIKY